jgi:hypothetical protein
MTTKRKRLSTVLIIVISLVLVTVMVAIIGYYVSGLQLAKDNLSHEAKHYVTVHYPDFIIIKTNYTPHEISMDSDYPATYTFTLSKKTNTQIKFNVEYFTGKNDSYFLNDSFNFANIYNNSFHEVHLSDKAKDNLYVLSKKYRLAAGEDPSFFSIDQVTYVNSHNNGIHDELIPIMANDISIHTSRTQDRYFLIYGDLYYLENDNWILVQKG